MKAKQKIQNIRSEVVFDYVKNLQLQKIVNPDYLSELAKVHMDAGRFSEAANIIIKFKFFDKFDIMELIMQLVEANRVPSAKLLLDCKPELKVQVIRNLSNQKHHKVAANFVKDYKMNPDDFPELQSIIARNSSCYFISRAFRARNHSEFLPLHKIEDLF